MAWQVNTTSMHSDMKEIWKYLQLLQLLNNCKASFKRRQRLWILKFDRGKIDEICNFHVHITLFLRLCQFLTASNTFILRFLLSAQSAHARFNKFLLRSRCFEKINHALITFSLQPSDHPFTVKWRQNIVPNLSFRWIYPLFYALITITHCFSMH